MKRLYFVENWIPYILWKTYFPPIHLHLHYSGKQFSTNFMEKCRWKGWILWKTEFHTFCGKLSINPLTLEWKIVFHKFNGIHDSTVIFHEFCGILHNLWKASFPVEFSLPKVDDFPLKSPNLLAHPVCKCTKTQF